MSVFVQSQPFDVAGEVRALTAGRTDVGAVVTFTGIVRGVAKGRPIVKMELEHYPGMTERELARVEALALARWPLQGIRIIHRIGALEPGEEIVLVLTLSAHRQAAFEAAEFLMDYLKSSAPFWKKETGVDGVGHWVDARDTDDAALRRWDH
jgi:molybdopterin synthase catalytic subunit